MPFEHRAMEKVGLPEARHTSEVNKKRSEIQQNEERIAKYREEIEVSKDSMPPLHLIGSYSDLLDEQLRKVHLAFDGAVDLGLCAKKSAEVSEKISELGENFGGLNKQRLEQLSVVAVALKEINGHFDTILEDIDDRSAKILQNKSHTTLRQATEHCHEVAAQFFASRMQAIEELSKQAIVPGLASQEIAKLASVGDLSAEQMQQFGQAQVKIGEICQALNEAKATAEEAKNLYQSQVRRVDRSV